ncbi:MAG: hypothetical protein K8T91_20855 [Planctomycetes bacterium]|nr:hypothetical protein [Planctomycetota bacterium]
MRIAFCLVAIVGLLAIQPLDAAPLKTKDVAAGAKWVAHVDFDAMRESKLGGVFREKCLGNEDAQRKIKKFQEDTGVDPTKDMHSVTLYDTKFVEHSGVAIFRAGHIDSKKLLAKLKEKHPDHKSEEHGDVTVYSWTEGKGKKHEHQVSGAIYGRDAVLFSRDAKQLTAALDVLAGKADALSDESSLAEVPRKGTFVLVRGVGMNKEKTPFHLAVIRRSKQLAFAFGQSGTEVFSQGLLVAPNADSADKVRDVVEGFRALTQLRFGDHDKRGEMLRGVKVAVAGSTVVLEWQGSGDDVAKLMVEHHEKMHQWKKLRGAEEKSEKGAKGEKSKKGAKDKDDDED